MKQTKVAKRYAKALFDLCLEQELLNRVDQDMHMIHTIYRESREFRLLLKSPIISKRKKNSVLKALLNPLVHQLTLSFSKLMVEHDREALIGIVADEYHILFKKHMGIVSAELITSEKVSEKLRSEIVDIIEEQTGGKVELTEKVDESIIGGFVLQVEDRQFDASVIAKIKRLSREFNVNVYQKGF